MSAKPAGQSSKCCTQAAGVWRKRRIVPIAAAQSGQGDGIFFDYLIKEIRKR